MTSKPVPPRSRSGARLSVQGFIENQASSGLVLLAAAALALLIANSAWLDGYLNVLHRNIGGMSVAHWVNDGLMAIFFLLIGLEVKREFLVGHLSDWGRRMLPTAAALAGMAVPALIFVLFNRRAPENLRGWAIPAATDIAFPLGILALLGPRVPSSLKALLTAIAVIDDLLAIIVIALFYSGQIAIVPLVMAGIGLIILAVLNRSGVRSLTVYLLIGMAVWYGVLRSGIHATLAGVAVAFTIPLDGASEGPPGGSPPLERLEHALQPWCAFLIVPLFGFANAGVSFAGMSLGVAGSPLPLGVMLGLFLGKQAGIFAVIFAMIKMRIIEPPAQASWMQIYGMAVLCGIGFTMSLFIGGLAFPGSPEAMDQVKIGVLSGSILSGVFGWLLFRRAQPGGSAPAQRIG